ncbi:MAG: hypothetical protein U0441_00495 [Polyangiaceae bacterium]
MPPPEKRPGPPAPDPNWERELHPPPGGARKGPPDARDPLLAHAVLQAREPDPLDLPLFDDPTEVDRATVPPPEEMSDHVARMMAQASALDDVDDVGDRPTPLVELPPSFRKQLDSSPSRREVSPAPPPARAPWAGAAKDARPAPARAAPAPPIGRPPRGVGAPDPRVDPGDDGWQMKPAVEPPPRSLPRAEPPPPSGALRANIAAIHPVRSASRPNVPAAQPARPASRPNMPAVQPPARPASRPNMPAVQPPARPVSRPNMPAVQPARPPSSTGFAATRPVRPPSRGDMAAVRPASAQAPATAAPPIDLRLDSLDFSELPAVFALDDIDGDVTVEAPANPGAAFAAVAEDTWSEPARTDATFATPAAQPWSEPTIDVAPEPWSEPAISPPFDSEDLRRTALRAAPPDKLAAIEARIAAGDYGRALVLAEAALVEHPGDSSLNKHAESCRDKMYRRYLERLGAVDHVPRLAVHAGAITGLALDHRAGFLLSCIDGGSTVEEIIDVSAMPRLDAVRILYELVQEGVIEMKTRR